MRILLSNHHLLGCTGTETYTYTLSKLLQQHGHKVTIYSKYLDNIPEGHDVTNSLSSISHITFDVAHVHHNINSIEIRRQFPLLPIVLQVHGQTHPLEQLAPFDLNLSKILVISEGLKKSLTDRGVNVNKIAISRNLIDKNLFFPKKSISEKPKSAIIISAYLPEDKEFIIKSACQQLNINLKLFGGRFGTISQEKLVNEINGADIVFSLGRGAIEAMFCGRIPIVYDYQGADGMVTPTNFKQIARENFSGRIYNLQYKVDDLVSEIKKYDQSYGTKLQKLAHSYYDADSNT